MSEMVRAVAPTAAQYEALMAPPIEHFDANQLFEHEVSCYKWAGLATSEVMEPLRALVVNHDNLFLLIPPKPKIEKRTELDNLIYHLVYKNRLTKTNLYPQSLRDDVEVPSGVYVMNHVQDGRDMLDISPSSALGTFRWKKRSPLTWFESFCLSLCFGKMIFEHHDIYCAGSSHGDQYKVVPIFQRISHEGKFKVILDGLPNNSSDGRRGSPSCASRIGIEVADVPHLEHFVCPWEIVETI